MKVYCYGLKKETYPYYENKAKELGFELTQIQEPLTEKTMKFIPHGVEAIVISPKSNFNHEILNYLKTIGIKYLTTASAGFEHIDLETAARLNFKIGRVPAFSPTSVASWTLAAGLELLKKTNLMFAKTAKYDFTVDQSLMSKEFKDLTIGIVGVGRIGYETANYFHLIGCKVLGFDKFPNAKAKLILSYVDLETLLKTSDLVVIQINHVKGENDNFVNQEFIDKMKDGAYLINAARGALVDLKALKRAIESKKILGAALDVFPNETPVLKHSFSEAELQQINPELGEILKLNPRVLVSSHLAAFTDQAVKDIAETSLINLKQLRESGTCDTSLT